MPLWNELHTKEELRMRDAAGYGARIGDLGTKPALLVIDVVRAWTGDEGDDHATSIAKFRTACGPVAWQAIPRLRRLLDAARERGLPIVYTKPLKRPLGTTDPRRKKSARIATPTEDERTRGGEFPAEIAPREGELVIEKTKPSGFFRTQLLDHLQSKVADHLIVTGTSTSGCVRATVYDGFNHDYPMTVVADCCFDRFETSHKANLFDMDAKYADVAPLAHVLAMLDRFPVLATSAH